MFNVLLSSSKDISRSAEHIKALPNPTYGKWPPALRAQPRRMEAGATKNLSRGSTHSRVWGSGKSLEE